jgi:hypothetical protein
MGRQKRYRMVDVVFTPLKRHIRYQILSPLQCARMDGPIQNRGTHTLRDAVWVWAFGSAAAVRRFFAAGKVVQKRMRLTTLGYKPCDFALEPPPSRQPAGAGAKQHATSRRRPV